MKHFLYILYSANVDRYYIGESQDPENRLLLHNKHHFSKNYTRIANDWKLVCKFPTETKQEALYLEKFIKRMKSKTFVQKIITNPSILQDILNKK